MRVNYGRQEWYRTHGTEPACSSCVHYQPHPTRPGVIWCAEQRQFVEPTGICTKFERAAGAD